MQSELRNLMSSELAWNIFRMLCRLFLLLITDYQRSWSTWTISRKGSTGTIKVIDRTIKLKTLCTRFQMALAANLHYSCISPTLPMYEKSFPPAHAQPEVTALITRCSGIAEETALDILNWVRIYIFFKYVGKPSAAFVTVLLMLWRNTFLFCLQYHFTM